jgi:hypothetical protein
MAKADIMPSKGTTAKKANPGKVPVTSRNMVNRTKMMAKLHRPNHSN